MVSAVLIIVAWTGWYLCIIFLQSKKGVLCVLDANANTNAESSFSLCLSHPLQYITDDLDYSQFYDYSEGATDTVPTDEFSEPQVNGKKGKWKKKDLFTMWCLFLSVSLLWFVLCAVCVSHEDVYLHTNVAVFYVIYIAVASSNMISVLTQLTRAKEIWPRH